MMNSPFFYLAVFISIITESLPISSSSHVYLISQWVAYFFSGSLDPSVLQRGELLTHGFYILVLAIFFRQDWWVYIKTFPRSFHVIQRVMILGFIVESITVIFYVAIYKHYQSTQHVAYGLIVTSLLLYSLRYIPISQRCKSWDVWGSCILGCAQGIAFFPGISRFASTFVAARWIGMNSRRAFEVSFLIAVPINAAAFLLGLVSTYDIQHCCMLYVSLVMLIASFFMYLGLIVVKSLIREHKLWYFSIYVGLLACLIVFQQIFILYFR